MRYQQEQAGWKADRRDAIVLTAAELFLKEGVQQVSMVRIAEACELGVATIYRYFGTKASILVEAGTLLWADLGRLFEGFFASDGYRTKSGMAQMEELLGFSVMLYQRHAPFLRFLREFDTFVLAEQVPKEKLAAYEASVLNLYPLFEAAYAKACGEGTARPGIDLHLLYSSVSHALVCMSQKFLQGDVLQSDASADKEAELRQLLELTLAYLRA